MMRVIVTAAILERAGRLLVTRRLKGTHLEGVWEFPGGKCEAGETFPECLARELREELGIAALIGDEVFATAHEYADRIVELHFLACTTADEPSPRLGQEMRWVARDELRDLEFPPADAELIQLLTGTKGSAATSAS